MNRDPAMDAWIAEAEGRDIADAAARMGAQLKRQGSELVGPCPVCGGQDCFAVSARKKLFNCRRAGEGGTVIRMAMHVLSLRFLEACEWLNGSPPPGRKPSEVAANAAPPAPRDAKADDKAEEAYRAKEIAKAAGIWEAGQEIAGTLGEAHLAARGLTLSPSWPLAFAPAQPYWHARGRGAYDLLYTGPAVLAAATDHTGTFTGCHITWFDPDRLGTKIALPDPDREGEFLPAKKLRGTKRKAAIRLVTPKGFTRLVIGEGYETTLSVYEAERAGFRVASSAFWAGIDLGHIGGKAAATVAHPALKTEKGKPRRVGGPVPEAQPDRDLDLPDQVQEVVLLGDGDSDPVVTENALRRAAARWAAPGRIIRVAWAPAGADFNDVLLGRAA